MSIIDIKGKAISDLKDPFSEECIREVHFSCYKQRIFTGGEYYSARVEFVNGNTKGRQDFEAESFPALVKKVETFVKELRNV